MRSGCHSNPAKFQKVDYHNVDSRSAIFENPTGEQTEIQKGIQTEWIETTKQTNRYLKYYFTVFAPDFNYVVTVV